MLSSDQLIVEDPARGPMYGRAFLAGLFAYGIARPAFATHVGLTTASSSLLSAHYSRRSVSPGVPSGATLTVVSRTHSRSGVSGNGDPCSCSPRRRRPPPVPYPKSSFPPFWDGARSAHSAPRSSGR
jgi:hypothetical protein